MKSVVLTLLLGGVLTTATRAQQMNEGMENEVKSAVLAFNEATAQRDIETLRKVLHPDYRVLANRFRGTPGTTLIARDAYLAMMAGGKIGGTVYELDVSQIRVTGHTALADVLLKTKGVPGMHKYLLLVQNEQDQWQVISDLPMEMK